MKAAELKKILDAMPEGVPFILDREMDNGWHAHLAFSRESAHSWRFWTWGVSVDFDYCYVDIDSEILCLQRNDRSCADIHLADFEILEPLRKHVREWLS